MKKQISCALLTIGLFSLNVMPAKAVNDVSNKGKASLEAIAPGQFCVYFPWVGEICLDL